MKAVRLTLPVLLASACGSPASKGAEDAAVEDVAVDAAVADTAPDMGCVQSVSSVPITGHADVIFVGDNSASMGTALEHFETHLEPFVALLDARGIDVRIILLSLRARGLVTINNSQRYGLCIPPPLAGDDDCGDGTRFFQRSVDVLSTAVLEQVLGTLGQTAGYTATDPRGGPEWASLLRPRSAPSFVIISDDNARFNADNFETFAGGQNPFNGLTLPPGVLDPSWGGRFTGYGVSGVYGWGSETDPTARCTFANNTSAASSGPTYTDLVARTGGVRARICDEAAGWDTFIEARDRHRDEACTVRRRASGDAGSEPRQPSRRLDPARRCRRCEQLRDAQRLVLRRSERADRDQVVPGRVHARARR